MINCLELFAGIGGWKKALDNLAIKNFTIPAEIDQDTINAYSAIHNSLINNNGFPIIDITSDKFNIDFKADIIFMSPPCQNYSKSKQCSKRETDNLISYTLPIIKKIMPRYVIGENVVNYTNYPDFDNWKNEIIKLGYKITCQILNPLEHNWPQNRPRFYWIAFKNEADYKSYQWPKKEEFIYTLDNIINANNWLGNTTIKDLPVNAKLRKNGNGMIWGNYIDNRCYLPNRYVGTITATFNQPWILINNNKVRKLTWRECFLLMGFNNKDLTNIEIAIKNNIFKSNSNSKFKKMAGNSLVVPLIEKILKGLNYD